MARRLQGFAVVASTLGITLALAPVVTQLPTVELLAPVLVAALLPLYLVVSLVPQPVPPWPRPPAPPEPRPDPHPVDPRSPRGWVCDCPEWPCRVRRGIRRLLATLGTRGEP